MTEYTDKVTAAAKAAMPKGYALDADSVVIQDAKTSPSGRQLERHYSFEYTAPGKDRIRIAGDDNGFSLKTAAPSGKGGVGLVDVYYKDGKLFNTETSLDVMGATHDQIAKGLHHPEVLRPAVDAAKITASRFMNALNGNVAQPQNAGGNKPEVVRKPPARSPFKP